MPNLAACGAADALGLDGVRAREEVAAGLNRLLAEAFVLYLKDQETSTGICRDRTPATITPLLDEQSDQIFAITDPLAEGVRKLGGTTLRSIGHITRLQRVLDNDAEFVTPHDMLGELRDDNNLLAARMRETHGVCDENGDRQRQPARDLDRRGGTARLVPLRGEPARGHAAR